MWDEWLDRITGQARDGLAAMDANASETGEFAGAGVPDGGDVAVVCAYQMAKIATPWVVDREYPALEALAERAMTLTPFRETYPG